MNHTLKAFAKYVSLNVMGMIGLSFYILADTFFVSKALGSNGLTALNFCISIYSVIQGFGLMIGMGGATRYNILKTSGDHKNANAVFGHALSFGLFMAAVFFTIGLFFSRPLAELLGADAITLPLADVYLKTIMCFGPFFVINNVMLAFVRNDGNPRLSMIAMLVSSFSNVILDYIFMFPLSMGMFGAAFATGLSPMISLLVLSLHFLRKKNKFSLRPFKFSLKKIGDIASLGSSSFIGELSSAIVLITFNLAILKIEGNTGVAAYGVVANIALIAVAIFTGVAQGLQPLASQGYGCGDKLMVRRIIRYSVITVLTLACIIYFIIFFGSGSIVSIFNSEGNEVLAILADRGIKIYFVGFFFAGTNIIAAALLSAIADAKKAFMISILRSCVLIVPMVLILSAAFMMDGIWLSFVLTELAVFALSVIFLFKCQK